MRLNHDPIGATFRIHGHSRKRRGFFMLRTKAMAAALLLAALATGSRAFAQFETRANVNILKEGPHSVVVGDFNGDGIPDVATIGYVEGAGRVQVLLGNGDGTFRLGATYSTDAALYGAAASLRRNGILDLIFGGLGTDAVYVMLGNGDGTFQPPVSYAATGESQMIALGDFMGDGKIDIVDLEDTSSQGIVCDCIEVLPGNGDGTFGPPISTLPVPYSITGVSIAAGNFSDDGKLDLAVGGFFGYATQVDILLGNGDGTFTPDGYYSLGASPGSVATGYFTSDKKDLDMALTNDTTVDVMLGNGNATFQQPVFYDTWFPSWVIALDLNGDGKIDLAASNSASLPVSEPGVTVFYGNGDGTFQPGIFFRVGSDEGGSFVAAGDFNGDGKPDLLVVNAVNGDVTTLLNTGVAHFSPTTPLNFKEQAVGTTSLPQTVTLTNTGKTALKIASMKATAQFGVTSTCGSSVEAGANCMISATFSPIKKGAAQGTITIVDSASSKPQVIALLGTGT